MERITYGNDSWNLELAGRSLGDIMSQYRALFNIPENARVEVNGGSVSSDYVLQAGDQVEAVRETGAKGCVAEPAFEGNFSAAYCHAA